MDKNSNNNGNKWVQKDGLVYDENGSVVSVAYKVGQSTDRLRNLIAKEQEETYRLSEAELEHLRKYPHALDYQFTEAQLKFLEDNGYVVLENFFSAEMMDKMVKDIFMRAHQLTGLVRDDINTWESSGRFKQAFMDLWHLPAYYELRQDPRIYSVFAQILNDPKLTVSLDRVSLKPPAYVEVEENGQTKKLDFSMHQRGLAAHTDMNLWYLKNPIYQGSICLEDCPVGSGGFTVMPGYHKLSKIRQYRVNYEMGGLQGAYGVAKRSPPSEESIFLMYEDKEAIKRDLIEVPMKKGDFLIWSSRLPHGNATNVSNRWRIQCFIRALSSAEDHLHLYRAEVRKSSSTALKPGLFSTGNSTNHQNREWEVPYVNEIPKFSDLGQKLLGFERWT